jgi:hypothetical protein
MGCRGGSCSRKRSTCSGGSCSRKSSSGTKGLSPAGKINLMTPQQTKLLEELSGLGTKALPDIYANVMQDPSLSFAPIEQAAQEGFTQQSIPTLADRFTNIRNSRENIPFMQLLGSAQEGLNADLAAQKALYGQQMLGNQQNFLNVLLGQAARPQFEPVYQQRPAYNTGSMLGGALMGMAPMFFGRR